MLQHSALILQAALWHRENSSAPRCSLLTRPSALMPTMGDSSSFNRSFVFFL